MWHQWWKRGRSGDAKSPYQLWLQSSKHRISGNRARTDGTNDEKSRCYRTKNLIRPPPASDFGWRKKRFLSYLIKEEEVSWVFVSLALIGPSWVSKKPKASGESVVPSPSSWPWPYHSLRLSHTGSGDFGHNWRVRNLKSLKGLQINEMTSHCTSYIGGKPSGI